MRRRELVNKISSRVDGASKDLINEILDASSEVREEELLKNGKCKTEFGTLTVKYRREVETYNPILDRRIILPAKNYLKFSINKNISEKINK